MSSHLPFSAPTRLPRTSDLKRLVARSYVPSRTTRLGQAVSTGTGLVSSEARMLPGFLIVGAQRCGTTSMYRALSQHPGILKPVWHKEVHYFDVAYHRTLSWYRAHFPLTASARWIKHATGISPLAFEASPYYMFHPLAGERIVIDLPDVKLLVLLGDPVERAYSAHTHEVAFGHEHLPFELALELEDSRLEGEVERIVSEPHYLSHSHRHHAYRKRGEYIDQLERLERLVGRDRIHVIDSGDFFERPHGVYDAVIQFLGLPHRGYPAFGRYNANRKRRAPMAGSIRRALEEYFLPFDERLAQWLGRDPSWRR